MYVVEDALFTPSPTVIVYEYTLSVSLSAALSASGVADHDTVSVEPLMSHAKSSASLPLSVQVREPTVSVSVIVKLSMFADVPSSIEKVVVPAV